MAEVQSVPLLECPWNALRGGNWTAAVQACETVLARGCADADTLRALAIGLWKLEDSSSAIHALQRAVSAYPGDADSWSDLGVLQYERGDWPAAAESFAASLRLRPANLTALHGRAESLFSLQRCAEAMPLFEQCMQMAPDRMSFAISLGHCLIAEGRLPEAADIAQQCWQVEKTEKPLLLMALLEHRQLRLDAVLALTEAAHSINPDSFETCGRLALARWDCGDLEGAVDAREAALTHKPVNRSLHTNLTWLSLHDPDQTAQTLREIHRAAALAWSGKIETCKDHWNAPDIGRRLRIGYLSGEFIDKTAAAYFLGSWLKHQDRKNFESFYYISRQTPAANTGGFQRMADHWCNVWMLTDAQIADLVREDAIDILVDLSGHYEDNRLAVFVAKPAPIQVSFPNYPGTTGVDQIDYIFTDQWTTPDGCEHEYVEHPFRLPGGYLAYDLGIEAPSCGPLPALANGYVTFGLLQRPGKYHSLFWDAVANILHRVPRSRLLIHFTSSDLDEDVSAQRQRFRTLVEGRGINPNRLVFRGARPLLDHLRVVAEADIALDSFPYNGQTTTCDCLWMGVPVISLRGSSHVARVGEGLLERIGLRDLSANSIEQYVATAVRLANDFDRVSSLRDGLRARSREHLANGRRLAREIEAAYRFMWKKWCESASRDIVKQHEPLAARRQQRSPNQSG
jgi:predicted O-linked N-acetylglucosamine transferase (SPINDLY family)